MIDPATPAPPAPVHPGTVERVLVVLWDGRGSEGSADGLVAAVDHRFTALGIGATAVATMRDSQVTTVCASYRLHHPDLAPTTRHWAQDSEISASSAQFRRDSAGPVTAPVAVSADRILVPDDLGDGVVADVACGWDLVPDAPPVPDAARWPAPGLGLGHATGTVVAVTARDATGDRPPRPGLVRHDTGIAHLSAVEALTAPPDTLPTVAGARLAVRAPDGTTSAWSLAGDDVLDAVDLVAGTRWPGAVRTPDGAALSVTCRLPMRALGPTDGWWDPERWHDELAVGVRRLDADARPADVRHLHTLAVVCGVDGTVGTLELLLLGAFDRHGLSGFVDGWRAPRTDRRAPTAAP